jgi:surface antigen
VVLHGDAADWWEEADGRYRRTVEPREGAILVLARSARLPSGHVAVVARVLRPREILVVQANWVRGELDEDQPVVDVSSSNDWSAVRLWWPPDGQIGTHVYRSLGFVLPDRPLPHAALLAGAGPAAVAAGGS